MPDEEKKTEETGRFQIGEVNHKGPILTFEFTIPRKEESMIELEIAKTGHIKERKNRIEKWTDESVKKSS